MQALLLGITPIDFMPLEGPVAALFDLIALPLLIFLSLKLVPTDVSELHDFIFYLCLHLEPVIKALPAALSEEGKGVCKIRCTRFFLLPIRRANYIEPCQKNKTSTVVYA